MDDGPTGMAPSVQQVLHLHLGAQVIASSQRWLIHALLHVDDQQSGVYD